MKTKQPKWLEQAIFYEIYPQSFKDSNGDGVGDIQGIIEKLDHIKDLGCNAIWLNPCFESPFGDAGYDVADYYKVAKRYGTNDDLKALFDACHERDMHVFLDLVPGHTSVEHSWFKESQKAETNEYTHRYVWTDSVWNAPLNMGWIRGLCDRDGACIINFFSNQPALNYGFADPDPAQPWQQATDAPGPQKTLAELINIMRFWLTLGCDGFRVDMAGSLVKNDPDHKATIKLWQKVRTFLDNEFPDAAMVSEWGEPEKAIAGGFHMDFLLQFGPSHYNDLFRCENPYFAGKGDISVFAENYKKLYAQAHGNGYICIPSGNHDTERLARTIRGDRLKLAFAFLLSMPGIPFIYYGDEIGMQYVEGLTSVEGGFNRTGSRTPMQWDASENAGFSCAPKERLYIRQDEDPNRPNVHAQLTDDKSLLNEIKKLTALRKQNKALGNTGEMEFVHVGYPLAYWRYDEEQKIMVIINPSDSEQTMDRVTGEVIYQFGDGLVHHGDKTIIKPCSAVFVAC